jgi:hypothetical protein
MNDAELDQALNQWQAPEPPPALRAGVRAGFPRAGRRRSGRPLRWLLAAGLASAAVVAMGQVSASPDNPFVSLVTHIYEHLAEIVETHRVMALVSNIRQSEPKVLVDGAAAPPLEFQRSSVFRVQVPGDRPYLITFWDRSLRGWTEAGSIRGNRIEFQAGAHRVVVQCSTPLGGDGMLVFVRRAE